MWGVAFLAFQLKKVMERLLSLRRRTIILFRTIRRALIVHGVKEWLGAMQSVGFPLFKLNEKVHSSKLNANQNNTSSKLVCNMKRTSFMLHGIDYNKRPGPMYSIKSKNIPRFA